MMLGSDKRNYLATIPYVERPIDSMEMYFILCKRLILCFELAVNNHLRVPVQSVAVWPINNKIREADFKV